MSSLIPHLRTLWESPNGYDIPGEFVVMFVRVHSDDWRVAQSHWEVVVAKVLDTDAIEARATGRKAMHQAVKATFRLLDPMVMESRCPMCWREVARDVRA